MPAHSNLRVDGCLPRGVQLRETRMAAKRATHARPIRGGSQGLLAPTIIIADLNAALTNDEGTSPHTAT